jgi:hypothetical protein
MAIDFETVMLLSRAFYAGYELGKLEAEENVEERLDNAFDEGFEQGAAFQELEDEEDTERTANECFDDGYLEGVNDARNHSYFADEEVQRILNSRAGAHYDQLELLIDEA